MVEAEPNLSTVDVDTLKDRSVAFLDTFMLDDVVTGYEWTAPLKMTKKVKRTREGDLVAEIKYPDGKRNCILSDGKKYGEDWVLLSENRDGARARKKPRKEKPQKKK